MPINNNVYELQKEEVEGGGLIATTMWLPFWRPKNRFTLDELRYLTDQLMKFQVVNEVNKDFVIEALRSIAELITYGDQHDANFFEFFMEKQVMGEFVRLLKISKTGVISLQLLQTMSIVIQSLKSEPSIYYLFSNEHINCLMNYSFDFRNEELLSYYISFLRAISGKLNKNTISLLVKTQNEEVIAFPLYVEAIRFAFHGESMIRTAVRAITLNVYHVGDRFVNEYIASAPNSDYFLNLVKFLREQCISLNILISKASVKNDSILTSTILSAVDEIEDNLYYFSDVISAGIPDFGRLISDGMLKLLIFPLLLPSLKVESVDGTKIGPVTALYLLCCILRIVKIKELSNIIAAALFCSTEAFVPNSEANLSFKSIDGLSHERNEDSETLCTELDSGSLNVFDPSLSLSTGFHKDPDVLQHNCKASSLMLRDALLSYITIGDDVQVVGSLSVLATLLQTKELDESMLDALGILPQRKQHKKHLLAPKPSEITVAWLHILLPKRTLVGEGSGEEHLFLSKSNTIEDGSGSELSSYQQRLKDQYGVSCSGLEVGASPRIHRNLVLDALVSLLCRSDISAETLWDGGWLLRQLLPYSEAEFNSHHLQVLKDSYKNCCYHLIEEVRGAWPDQLIAVLCDEWRECKRAIEASSPRREPKFILFPSQKSSSDESSLAAGERMYELVKVFVLLHQLQIFSLGRALPDQPSILPPSDVPENSRAKTAGLGRICPKPSAELSIVDAVPCRIAFERGKERHFCFLAISMGSSGWVVLAEELPLKPHYGIVRVAAPLAGSKPHIDEKHTRWLHLRIRPTTFPLTNSTKHGKVKTKALVDGRWTLAFKDDESCKSALSMIVEEMNIQSNEVERRIKPLLNLERDVDRPLDSPSSSETTYSNSL